MVNFNKSTYVNNRASNKGLYTFQSQGHAQCTRNSSAEQVQYVEPQEDRTLLWPLSP